MFKYASYLYATSEILDDGNTIPINAHNIVSMRVFIQEMAKNGNPITVRQLRGAFNNIFVVSDEYKQRWEYLESDKAIANISQFIISIVDTNGSKSNLILNSSMVQLPVYEM